MDILRRNTDYALRAMVNLARSCGDGGMSTRRLSQEAEIPYPLACKLLQKLHKKKLVESSMGPQGGFRLGKDPAKITLLDVISAIQGPIRLNNCLLGVHKCPRRPRCPVSRKLTELQTYIDKYLGDITLAELVRVYATLRKGPLTKP